MIVRCERDLVWHGNDPSITVWAVHDDDRQGATHLSRVHHISDYSGYTAMIY
jgi:hypothetical protein